MLASPAESDEGPYYTADMSWPGAGKKWASGMACALQGESVATHLIAGPAHPSAGIATSLTYTITNRWGDYRTTDSRAEAYPTTPAAIPHPNSLEPVALASPGRS